MERNIDTFLAQIFIHYKIMPLLARGLQKRLFINFISLHEPYCQQVEPEHLRGVQPQKTPRYGRAHITYNTIHVNTILLILKY